VFHNIKARLDAKDEAKLLQFKQLIQERYSRKYPEVYQFREVGFPSSCLILMHLIDM
jgi:hypothetical protein